MTQLYAWALCDGGKIIEIYKTEIGGKRGLTRFTAYLNAQETKKWRVVRLKCLFDELETVNAQR